MGIKVSVSLMCMDLLHIASQVQILENYIDEFHMDIIDWHYCKNMALAPCFMKAIRTISSVPMEAHLYVDNIDMDLIDLCCESGANIITMPPEIIDRKLFHIHRELKKRHVGFGISLNPSMPVDVIIPYGHLIDRLLILSVDPGFAGQPFIETTYDRIQKAVQLREENHWHYQIEVDGCCNEKYYQRLYQSGADVFIVGGSGLFSKSKNTEKAARTCLDLIRKETLCRNG